MDIYCMFPFGFQTPVVIYVQANRPKRDYAENIHTLSNRNGIHHVI